MNKTAMLRSFFAVPLFALTFFALEPREALAMPTAQLSDVVSSPVEKTWGGCGPYGHRGPWGGCRRGGQWGGGGWGWGGYPAFWPFGVAPVSFMGARPADPDEELDRIELEERRLARLQKRLTERKARQIELLTEGVVVGRLR